MLDLMPAQRHPFRGLDPQVMADIGSLRRGKVRDIIDLGERLLLVCSDRVSAFDQVLGTVPFKGQMLNQLAAWWFEQVADIIDSHLIDVPDPNVSLVQRCRTLPVEVVVRSRLSGSTSTSLWTQYEEGKRHIYGVAFSDGMTKNQELPQTLITPTTKASAGGHDEPISETEIVANGLVASELWDEVRSVALEIFARGQQIALSAGLVLVDTKYEFGINDRNQLIMIDELHTPDSSRFWRESNLTERLTASQEPENLDKEIIRLAYAQRGYRGEGAPPELGTALANLTAQSYAELFEMLTGSAFQPARYPADVRVTQALQALTLSHLNTAPQSRRGASND